MALSLHLQDLKFKAKAICQQNDWENLRRVGPTGFIVQLLHGDRACKHCLKRIRKDPTLLDPAEAFLKDEVYGMFLLQFQALTEDVK